jgi:hypothetical protein
VHYRYISLYEKSIVKIRLVNANIGLVNAKTKFE